MHIAGKIFLGLGVLMLVGGGAMTWMGGDALEDVGEWDVEEKSSYSGVAGSSDFFFGGDDLLVMVRDDVRCDEFTFEMTNETDENLIRIDCEEDGEKPYGWADDPNGWYHMTTISAWEYAKGEEYTLNANEDFELVPMWEVLGDELGEAGKGLAGILGGIGIFGCGICSLILGGVLALVLKDEQPPTQMV